MMVSHFVILCESSNNLPMQLMVAEGPLSSTKSMEFKRQWLEKGPIFAFLFFRLI